MASKKKWDDVIRIGGPQDIEDTITKARKAKAVKVLSVVPTHDGKVLLHMVVTDKDNNYSDDAF